MKTNYLSLNANHTIGVISSTKPTDTILIDLNLVRDAIEGSFERTLDVGIVMLPNGVSCLWFGKKEASVGYIIAERKPDGQE